MRIPFDTQRPFFALKLLFLMGLVLFSGDMFSRELAEFLIPDDLATYTPLPPPESRPPKYRILPGEAVIYSTQDEVLRKKQELVSGKNDFVWVDLEGMTLNLYREGELLQSFPVRAKGEEGSFSETPNGYYKVQAKESKHFSKIHKVWMPWSMHFFGNYFIHGWPYLPNGTPVRSTTSGGCIRLSTNDAKVLYDFVNFGTPVLVSADDGGNQFLSEFTYFRKVMRGQPLRPPASFSAESALVADLDTGQILFEMNKDKTYPVGTITKIMTAVVATEAVDDAKYLWVSKYLTDEYGNTEGFARGDQFRAHEMLYFLLLASSDIAAKMYEREKWQYVGIMNEKARAIGLEQTSFVDTTGVSEHNISTAEELFRLLRFINFYKRPVFERSGLGSYILTSRFGRRYEILNLNWPKDDLRFVAGKSGITPAGLEAMAGVYKVKLSEHDERSIAVIVLNSRDRTKDVAALIGYLEDNFIYGSMFTKNKRKPLLIRAGASVYAIFGGF